MTIKFWFIGKDKPAFVEDSVELFFNRIKKYQKVELEYINAGKFTGSDAAAKTKQFEATEVLKRLKANERLILLDEKGKTFNSRSFASWMENQLVSDSRSLIFLIGGAFGFDQSVYERAETKLRLSDFTFSHQLARPILLEQVYRAFTIIRNEPYHND